ncbi:MAG TPA: TIGR00266 family protein [Methylotenera sp.]|nr:TIGR00266 family protein [Methylotenera sp.]
MSQPNAALHYEIHGNDLQYVLVTLQPGHDVIAEQGAMMYVDEHIVLDAVLGDGSASKFGAIGRFFNAIKRSFTGESMFSSIYTNQANYPQNVAVAAPSPGQIVPINLDEQGGTIICQKGAYLAGERGQKIQLTFQKRVRVGLFGGEGFIMQKITGQGTVFIHASGTLKQVALGVDDTLKIDTGCLVGMSSNVRYDIQYTGKLKTSLFGGEGLFYATVSGPGNVWMQSLPMNRLSRAIVGAAVAGRSKGSIWGKLYLIGIVVFVLYTLIAGR